MFDNLSLREKVIIFIGIILLLLAVYYFYFYLPLSEELSRLENTLENKRTTVKNIERSISDFDEVEARHIELSEEIASIDEEEEKEEEKEFEVTTTDLLKYFNDIIEVTDVEMRTFRPTEDEEKVALNFSHNGSFYEIINFFDEIDKFQPDISYESLSLNTAKDELSSNITLVFPKPVEEGDEDENKNE